ncbi:long-chain-fatty-acid--CoA ligase [Citricoccus sp. SGAir0253]|uniref:acyl-CoA synthetase n=1 Tax=Citricoccus sp. SGAir0253 TaxID=2567881 RepID=UPI0010CD42AB|nr:long-chain fatty acid--CoA ligase [Citricoccus sp. SGAir0253]QCU77084.1 long-chain-fatty-acid--CoA ligase [Citricoccus sp. SGAir0253]
MFNRGIGDWIHRRRVKSAGHTAVISAAGELTYDAWAERIDRLADALSARGVAPGDRVAYLGENYPSFLEVLFAAGSLGAVFVPLNTRLAPPEIGFALEDSGSTVLVASATLEPLALAGSRGTGVGLLALVQDGPRAAAERRDGDLEPLDYEDLVASGRPERPDVAVDLDDLAIILYTSGTTGKPKGAMLTHGNLTWNAFNVLADFDVTSETRALMIAPMFHVASLGMGALPTLLKGGTLVLEPRFEPGRVLRLIEEHGITSMSGVPTTYQLLAEHPDWDRTDLSSLRILTCGGSAVPIRVLEAYEQRGLAIGMGYGMTETSPGATVLPARFSRPKQGSGGLPHFHTAVRVVDPLGERCAPGDVGEIQVQGPNVISAYWNRPEATQESFVQAEGGTWLKTGDMGYLDEEGFLFISDRLKDMIISGGENIYPAQVEQAIAELEAVAAVAVIGVPDEKWGEVPRAVVVVREGHELTEEQVIGHLDGKLARYKIPKSVVFVDEMPRTASGKIRKPDLRRRYGG